MNVTIVAKEGLVNDREMFLIEGQIISSKKNNEEVDIVEELLRVNGYDKLEDEQIKIDSYSRKRILSYEEHRNRLISSALVKRGLYEAVTFSFISKKGLGC